jgi:acid phosphatase
MKDPHRRRSATLGMLIALGLIPLFSWCPEPRPSEAAAASLGVSSAEGVRRLPLFGLVPGSSLAARPLLTAPPRPDHVVIVMEENHSYSEILQVGAAPYITSLSTQGVLFTNYFAQYHPSEQNYLELLSGSDQGIGNTDPVPAPGSPFTTANWGGDLPSAKFSFTGFSEGLPSTGYSGGDTGLWAYRHCPWIAFQGTGTHQIPV